MDEINEFDFNKINKNLDKFHDEKNALNFWKINDNEKIYSFRKK